MIDTYEWMVEIFNFSTIEKNDLKKFHVQKNPKEPNDCQGPYTPAHFWENCQKIKLKSQDPKKHNFLSNLPKRTFSGPSF